MKFEVKVVVTVAPPYTIKSSTRSKKSPPPSLSYCAYYAYTQRKNI